MTEAKTKLLAKIAKSWDHPDSITPELIERWIAEAGLVLVEGTAASYEEMLAWVKNVESPVLAERRRCAGVVRGYKSYGSQPTASTMDRVFEEIAAAIEQQPT